MMKIKTKMEDFIKKQKNKCKKKRSQNSCILENRITIIKKE